MKPNITCTVSYSNYQKYKLYLRSDFNKKCGYCDDLDLINGGKRTYQIDHFVPIKPTTCVVTIDKTEYSNLVYSCPFCNRAKSNKWPTKDEKIHNNGSVGFVDPCDENYDTHFYRNDLGEIQTNTALGQHIYDELDFFLKRHAILWNLERLRANIRILKTSLNTLQDSSQRDSLNQLLLEHSNFLDKLEVEND